VSPHQHPFVGKGETVKRRTVLAIVVAAVLLGLAAAVVAATLPQPTGAVELSATEFDFGAVSHSAPVSQVFQVRNAGLGNLRIAGVSTSCGCTTARVARDELTPGASTELTVTFDPLAHDGTLGEFLRVVYIRTNDPQMPEATLTIRGNVVAP
jgi:hypothetical protein